MLENEDLCDLPEVPDPNQHTGNNGQERSWERRAFPAFPHQDDIKYLHKLSIFVQAGRMTGTSDICDASFTCRYEENLLQADVNPRWFEADGHGLFEISQHPIEVTEFLQQTRMDREEGTPADFAAEYDRGSPEDDAHRSRILRVGGNTLFDDLVETYGPDILLGVAGDSEDGKGDLSFDCTRGCFPREVTFSVKYWQISPFRKKLISATVELNEYNKDPTDEEYTFGVDFSPCDWVELLIAFAFDQLTFGIIFFVLCGVSMIVAVLFYLVVRFSTRLETPPRFRFTSMLHIIVPPAMVGVLVAMAPIMTYMYATRLMLYGGDVPWLNDLHRLVRPAETYFLMDGQPAHYMIE